MENVQFDILTGKLDFVLQKGLATILVEVKSGNDYRKHLALNQARYVDNSLFEQSYVFANSNVVRKDDILYLLWYMVMFLKQEQMPDQMIYEVDLSGL